MMHTDHFSTGDRVKHTRTGESGTVMDPAPFQHRTFVQVRHDDGTIHQAHERFYSERI